jgi:hypothetical protein
MRILTLALGLLALTALAPAAEAATATAGLYGAVKSPLGFDQATLSALPATTIEVPYKSASGNGKDSYTGVLVWDLLKQAELINDEGKNSWLKHTILITAANGYAVSVAVGEFDPNYGAKQVLLAYKAGTNLASFDHLKLVVPGDVRGGRSVRDVVSIEVK